MSGSLHYDDQLQIAEAVIDALWNEPLDQTEIFRCLGIVHDNSEESFEKTSSIDQAVQLLARTGLVDFKYGLYLLTEAGRMGAKWSKDHWRFPGLSSHIMEASLISKLPS